MVNSALNRVSVRAFCEVCERRGWAGYVGTFEYNPGEMSTWTFTTNRRESKLRAGHLAIGDIASRPRSMPGFIHSGVPLRLKCPSGHRLRELDTESVVRLLDGASERVRLLAG